jgi:threonine-phosphate decarboxylase
MTMTKQNNMESNTTHPSEHGDDFQVELVANFSSNMWYDSDNDGLYKYLNNKLTTIERYPEWQNQSVKMMLANKLNVQTSQLMLCNGTCEGIYVLAQAFQSQKSLIVSPTFSEYQKACILNNHQIFKCGLSELEIQIKNLHPNLVWICTPNNPDGTIISETRCKALVSQFPNTNFVFDISFHEFTLAESYDLQLVNQYKNIVFIYSFTKRYRIPGIRIGYLCGSSTLMHNIIKYCIPWNINTLAIQSLRYILQKENTFFNIEKWLIEKKYFTEKIDSIPGFKCIESQTPFFLVQLQHGNAAHLKTYLLQHGILIRDACNFTNDGQQLIRLNTLSRDNNNLLINKLIKWTQLI